VRQIKNFYFTFHLGFYDHVEIYSGLHDHGVYTCILGQYFDSADIFRVSSHVENLFGI
jgi:hypothetical protein